MAPKLSGQNWIFLKFLLSLKPLYQIDAYKAYYQTRDQEFWNEMPPNRSMQITVELQVNTFLIRFQSQSA